jgi:hypothetical protein
MSLAYLILAHKNARQTARLFHAVYRPEHIILLHFDRRSDASLHALGQTLASRYPNVVVLPSRSVLWGGYEMAAVQLEAMRLALQRSSDWHHFINLSGQDFPIKSANELETFLRENPTANYVSWFDPVFKPLWGNARDRLDHYYLEWPWLNRILWWPWIGRRLRQLFRWEDHLPHIPFYRRAWPDFRYYGGSNHVVLSHAGCEYLTQAPEARRITTWLKHSAHANEIIFQTVLLNSPLAATVVNTHLRLIEFLPNSPNPRTFRLEDFETLIQSKKFFARKFDEAVDSAILDRLTEHCGLGVPSEQRTSAHS